MSPCIAPIRFQIESRSPRTQSGYTLIEVIVAFALLALALTLLLGTLSGAARQVGWAGDAGRAALHAQSLLDQQGISEPIQPGERTGEFDDGRYRWTLGVTPWTDPALPPAGPQPGNADRLPDSRRRASGRTGRARPTEASADGVAAGAAQHHRDRPERRRHRRPGHHPGALTGPR